MDKFVPGRLLIIAAALICLTLQLTIPQSFAKNYQSKKASFKLETVASGLEHPWSHAFLPNGDILITERTGKLRIVRKGKLDSKPVSGLPRIYSGGQGGLLDIVLHPKFKTNRLIYFSYSARGRSGIGTHVARAKFDGNRLSDVRVIFKAKPKTGSALHFGSRLLFDSKGYLFITLGDKYRLRQAQNLGSHLGSIIRLNDDGSVPNDNPFKSKAGALPEIYSYGHRNVQGIALHPVTKKVWAHEHGPRGGDELNVLTSGANYGWPQITYGIDYSGAIISNKTHLPGMEQPVTYWKPSIAPSGMAFYSGDKFPEWKGNLFVGALAHRHLRRIELNGEKVKDQEILLKDMDDRIRDVRMGPDGYLYILTDRSDGRLLRLKPVR